MVCLKEVSCMRLLWEFSSFSIKVRPGHDLLRWVCFLAWHFARISIHPLASKQTEADSQEIPLSSFPFHSCYMFTLYDCYLEENLCPLCEKDVY